MNWRWVTPTGPSWVAGIRSALTLSTAFLAFIWIAKEVPSLYLHEPWQNDPYDAMISFSFVAIPLLVGPMLLRLQLCKRNTPLPVRRVADLLRLSRVVVGTVGLTLVFQWTSVFGTRRPPPRGLP